MRLVESHQTADGELVPVLISLISRAIIADREQVIEAKEADNSPLFSTSMSPTFVISEETSVSFVEGESAPFSSTLVSANPNLAPRAETPLDQEDRL